MQRFEDSLEDYILRFTSPENPVLYELYRETYLTALRPDMVSGHLQGKIIEMLCRMIQPGRVLEIGTYTGYATICLATGSGKNAIIHTIEPNDEILETARRYFQKSGVENQIIQHIGKAQKIIPAINILFDLIFIDGDKREYPEYYEVARNFLRPGGFIIADNVLWWGKINEKADPKDSFTQGIQKFNELVAADSDFERVLLPVRDGLMLIQKKHNNQY